MGGWRQYEFQNRFAGHSLTVEDEVSDTFLLIWHWSLIFQRVVMTSLDNPNGRRRRPVGPDVGSVGDASSETDAGFRNDASLGLTWKQMLPLRKHGVQTPTQRPHRS